MADQQDEFVDVVNAPRLGLNDLYHHLLSASWWATLAAIALMFLCVNSIFAIAFHFVGGVANVAPDSFADAFFFSVQTLGTIGYGAMYPVTHAAETLVTLESIAAVIVSAISTGLVFSKFSMPRARLAFSREAALFDMDGQRTLAFRIANERRNVVVEAMIKVSFLHREKTPEGLEFYRMYELPLVRERSPALGRSWLVLHRLDEKSPLYKATPESLRLEDAELIASVMGIDGTTGQTIHARYRYDADTVSFGRRHADMLSEKGGGRWQLDFGQFHAMVDAKYSPPPGAQSGV